MLRKVCFCLFFYFIIQNAFSQTFQSDPATRDVTGDIMLATYSVSHTLGKHNQNSMYVNIKASLQSIDKIVYRGKVFYGKDLPSDIMQELIRNVRLSQIQYEIYNGSSLLKSSSLGTMMGPSSGGSRNFRWVDLLNVKFQGDIKEKMTTEKAAWDRGEAMLQSGSMRVKIVKIGQASSFYSPTIIKFFNSNKEKTKPSSDTSSPTAAASNGAKLKVVSSAATPSKQGTQSNNTAATTAQTNQMEAKAAFLLAEESYNKGNHKEALRYIESTKKSLGGANSKILYLQFQIELELMKADGSYYDKVMASIVEFQSAPDVGSFNEEKVLDVMKTKIKLAEENELILKEHEKVKIFIDSVSAVYKFKPYLSESEFRSFNPEVATVIPLGGKSENWLKEQTPGPNAYNLKNGVVNGYRYIIHGKRNTDAEAIKIYKEIVNHVKSKVPAHYVTQSANILVVHYRNEDYYFKLIFSISLPGKNDSNKYYSKVDIDLYYETEI